MNGAAQQVIADVRQSNSSVAVVSIRGHEQELVIDAGVDAVRPATFFEIASITKTMTALLLAEMVLAGEVRLDTAIGDVIDAGKNGTITVGQLATHTSGLPRLPGNLMMKASATPEDPYGHYGVDDLVAALHSDPPGPIVGEYSNYGYMVLGHVLTVVADNPYETLLRERVFDPLGMTDATADAFAIPEGRRVQGYRNNRPVQHWTKLIPGSGGVEASVEAMAIYLGAQLEPAATELDVAIEMTQRGLGGDELLGWQQMGSVVWHNGGSGGFSSFIGFDRTTTMGVVVLTNAGGTSTAVDGAGFRVLGYDKPEIG